MPIFPDLAGKVVLVTGSSRGIGASIARLFGLAGAKVAVHGRETKALSAVAADIERSGGTVTKVTGDVTSFNETDIMRQEIENKIGPIDVLVANVAGGNVMPGPIEDISEQDWHSSIDGTLMATFLTMKSVLPGMKRRKTGNIITISSAAGRKPHPQAPVPYSAAKAGIQIMTQIVATQAGPYGIRVNCIAPETILTERNRQRIPEVLQTAMAGAHPIARLGMPEDIAHAALFLASDASSWITGIVLDVAGGNVML